VWPQNMVRWLGGYAGRKRKNVRGPRCVVREMFLCGFLEFELDFMVAGVVFLYLLVLLDY
jgi:hypothetical protein